MLFYWCHLYVRLSSMHLVCMIVISGLCTSPPSCNVCPVNVSGSKQRVLNLYAYMYRTEIVAKHVCVSLWDFQTFKAKGICRSI